MGKRLVRKEDVKVEQPKRRGRPSKAMLAERATVKAMVTVETKDDKQAAKDTAFYAKYSWVVPGSVRDSTPEDTKVLKYVHKRVCLIRCQCCQCGRNRLVNTQDAFQTKRCAACTKGKNPDVLQAKIAALQGELNTLTK